MGGEIDALIFVWGVEQYLVLAANRSGEALGALSMVTEVVQDVSPAVDTTTLGGSGPARGDRRGSLLLVIE